MNDILHFTNEGSPWYRKTDLSLLIRDAIQSLESMLSKSRIHTELSLTTSLNVFVDPDMLRCAIKNLLVNAIDEMPNGGDLVMTVWQTEAGVEIEVADSGPGIDTEAFERLFNPAFSTKGCRRGSGLAIVQQIIELHQGKVIVENCPEGGAAFTLRVPTQVDRAAA